MKNIILAVVMMIASIGANAQLFHIKEGMQGDLSQYTKYGNSYYGEKIRFAGLLFETTLGIKDGKVSYVGYIHNTATLSNIEYKATLDTILVELSKTYGIAQWVGYVNDNGDEYKGSQKRALKLFSKGILKKLIEWKDVSLMILKGESANFFCVYEN